MLKPHEYVLVEQKHKFMEFCFKASISNKGQRIKGRHEALDARITSFTAKADENTKADGSIYEHIFFDKKLCVKGGARLRESCFGHPCSWQG